MYSGFWPYIGSSRGALLGNWRPGAKQRLPERTPVLSGSTVRRLVCSLQLQTTMRMSAGAVVVASTGCDVVSCCILDAFWWLSWGYLGLGGCLGRSLEGVLGGLGGSCVGLARVL